MMGCNFETSSVLVLQLEEKDVHPWTIFSPRIVAAAERERMGSF